MSNINSSLVRERPLKAIVGAASQALFPEAPYGSIQERFVHNPSATNPLAIRLVTPSADPTSGSEAAALNGGGSIQIPAGGSWVGSACNAINVIGTAGSPVTAGER